MSNERSIVILYLVASKFWTGFYSGMLYIIDFPLSSMQTFSVSKLRLGAEVVYFP
jgi:hypothetical protein